MIGLALLLLRRMLGIAVLVWLVTLGAFAAFKFGVPSPAANAQIEQQLGAGQPAGLQYAHYLLRLLHGNLGASLTPGLSVDAVLLRALPPTLSLMAGGMVLWLAGGVLAGAVSALRQGSLADRILTGAIVAGQAIPTFLIALLLLAAYPFLARAGNLWLQPGYVPFTHNPGAWLGRMILPWIAIAASQGGTTARLTRSGILDTLSADYVRTARAKGVPESRVLLVHVLRAAIAPVLTSAGASFGSLLGAAAIIDYAFALGGIGQQLLVAVTSSDLMVVMGTVLVAVIMISLVSLAADLCQMLIDPRARSG